MRMIIKENQLVIITEPKIIYFEFPKNNDNSLMHETVFIIKHNQLLAEHKMKNKISRLSSKQKHGNDIHGHGKQ